MKKPIRVLAVTETLGVGGGAEQLLVGLVPVLRQLGIIVDIAVLQDWHTEFSDELEKTGIRIYRFHAKRKIDLLLATLRLAKTVRQEGYDVIWGHLFFGNLSAAAASVLARPARSVITLHGAGYTIQEKGSWVVQVYRFFERFTGWFSDDIVAVSQSVKSKYQSYFGWHDIGVIYNGINVYEVDEAIQVISTKLSQSEADVLRIVIPARFISIKGHVDLVKALIKFNRSYAGNWKLFAPGEGPTKKEVQDLVNDSGLSAKVEFLEPMPHQKLLELVGSCQIVVIPSHHEGFGIAAAEAMALGRPCILTAVDGYLELVGDGDSALLVAVQDSDGIANALSRLAADKNLRAEIGAGAAKRVRENFSLHQCASNWFDRFSSLL